MSSGVAFDAATVLLMWSVGGLGFLWVTERRREVGLGYGWLLRSIFGAIALAAGLVALRWPYSIAADATATTGSTAGFATGVAVSVAGLVVATTIWSLVVSITRRAAGLHSLPAEIVAPAVGLVGLVVLAISQGVADDAGLAATTLHAARLVVGAAFLGVVSDAMLLGHWYLVQPGLRRSPLLELVGWLRRLWPLEVALLIVPTGMLSVLSGSIDDGYGGLLGWFWLACAITTIALAQVAVWALAEPQYSAVMAATGLLYLAILSGFGTDLVARLTLAA